MKVRITNMKAMNVTRDKWDRIVKAISKEMGGEPIPPTAALSFAGVCPHALITPLSWELFNLYCICDGLRRLVSPDAYYALPALYTTACAVIEDERAKFEVSNG